MKVHNPSVSKKKGATIEFRKMSGFEFSHVEILKDVVVTLLDQFISEKNKTSKSQIVKPKVKLFTCDICKWQTKFAYALKSHHTKFHQESSLKCDKCSFKAKNKIALNSHIKVTHRLNVNNS